MNVARRARRLRERATIPDDTPVGGRVPWLVLGLVVLAGIALRFWVRSDLWFDEALSVNISKLPLGDIPDALRRDGHPPLYYFLLHGWMSVFGSGDVAVRALSGVIAVASFPLVWFAGLRLGRSASTAPSVQNRRIAWAALIIFATSPYAFRYATEARMYSLVMFLVLTGYLVLRKALEEPTWVRLGLIALVTAALALTQYWCLYLIAVVGAGLVWRQFRAPSREERRADRLILASMVVGLLPFLAWLPDFLHQLANTGTPWGDPLFPWTAAARTIMGFAGSDRDGDALVFVAVLLMLLVLGTFGRGTDDRHVELDVRTRPAVRWEAATIIGAMALGTVASYATGTTFAPRYAAVVFPLALLVLACGVDVFVAPRIFVGVLTVVALFGLIGGVRNSITSRTQAEEIARVIAAESEPGDVVVYCPDQSGPAVSRLLEDVPGLTQMTFPDGDRPERVNWTDYLERANGADGAKFVQEVYERAGEHTVWFVTYSINHLEAVCGNVGNGLSNARVGEIRVTPDNDIFEFMGMFAYPPA